MSQESQDNENGIAIVGMAGRFPGACDVNQFWRNLRDGIESITFFTDDELRAAGVEEQLLRNPAYVKAGGVVADVEMFDADLFEFTPREAETTDPQHRLFLECAWEALENAGYDAPQFDGRIGVYAGAGPSSYLLNNLLPRPDVLGAVGDVAVFLGNNKDFVPTRVCYKLDLKGPGISVNTACSSSLVATHVACQALLDHQCDMAMAGGVGIQVPQQHGYLYQAGAIGSPDGHCRAFDAQAEGTVNGNGVGIVVLKRLEDALADGDFVHAVILSSAVNNDGAAKIGFTAPGISGQAECIAEAMALADVEPATINYIEAHGTGTRLGDPIEIAALSQAFGNGEISPGQHCAIGSVKTNIGHLDEAAGVAGLIKTVLAIRRRQIPPSLHYQAPNAEIDFAGTPFFVNSELSPWPGQAEPRRAGVSSFGIGGTNAHVVLEEAPLRQPSGPSRPWHLLTVSAKGGAALRAAASNLADHLESHPDEPLADVCYTLQVGRSPLPHRRAIVCRDGLEAVAALGRIKAESDGGPPPHPSGDRPVAFLFPGQGVQSPGMGRELYDAEPIFREELDRCADLFAPLLELDLRELLYAPDSASSDDRSPADGSGQLNQTSAAQPALFSFQYALARLWMSWGIRPQAMLGHSLGQYVAATLADVLTLDSAVKLIAARGRLLQDLDPGAMLAVGLTESELQPLLGSPLSLAAVNSPSQCVASGPLEAIADLENQLTARGVFCRRLQTSHAFHSPMVQPAVDEFEKLVRQVDLQPPQVPFLSNVSGGWITAAEATDPAYWATHMRATVRFSDSVEELLQREDLLMLEIGPGQTLSGIVKGHPEAEGRPVTCSMGSSPSNEAEGVALVGAVGELWVAGARVDWGGFHAQQRRQRLPLPSYPFQRQRFWIDPPAAVDTFTSSGPLSESGPGGAGTETESGRPATGEVVKNWIQAPAWRLSETRFSSHFSQPESWLIFADEVGLASGLVERLRAQARTIVEVRAGDRFEQLDPESYIVRPANAEDYAALCEGLRAAGSLPSRVLHAWNVTRQDNDSKDVIDRSIYSLLYLVQAIGSQAEIAQLQIDVISNGLFWVNDNDVPFAEKALLLGPLRVTPLEYPHIGCRSIDVQVDETNSGGAGNLIDQILSELSGPADDTIVAFRGRRRYTPTLERVSSESKESRLRDRGVYLITGGLGSMGLALAEHLAQQVRARLVLVGRSSLEPAAEIPPITHEQFAEKERQIEGELAIRGIDTYGSLEATLDELCASFAWEYFEAGGCGLKPGESCGRDELRIRLDVRPRFSRFFDRLLSFLTDDGILELAGNVVIRTTCQPRPVAEIIDEIEQQFESFAGLAKLLSHCASRYGPALSEEIEAITVLYPDGTSAFLDESWRSFADCNNDRLYVELAADILGQLPVEGRPLKILEVGGGGGTLTRAAAERLRGCEVDYWFTDLGRSFVVAAELEAAEHGIDFMRFAQLDISQDPLQQGFTETGFDAIVGYNVVHATPDVAMSTNHLGGLLAPGGLLLMAETVRQRRWVDMIWGLADAWWCYQDETLRGGGPLMDLDAWDRALSSDCFQSVITLPVDRERREKTESGLIIAQRAPLGANGGTTDSRDAGTRSRIDKLKRIERAGGEVLVLQADVANLGQMEDVVRQAEERFGSIQGVIHAAGVLGQGLIQTKTAAEIQKVLAPKVTGTRVLQTVLGELDLDFFVTCSSMASTFPIAGQVDYCAANAFLDAFAHESSKGTGLRVAIDWGFWQELGMIEGSKMPQSDQRAIVEEIESEGWSRAGEAAFERIMQCDGIRQVLVSPGFADDQSDRVLSHPWFESRILEETGLESFVAHLSPGHHWVLDEHRVAGKPTLPGTAYLEMARAAFSCREGEGPVELRDVYFLSPLVMEDGQTRELRTVLKPHENGYLFHVVSQSGGERWEEHARGEVLRPVRISGEQADAELLERYARLEQAANASEDSFAARVAEYPPRWRSIERFQFETDEALASLRLPSEFAHESADYGIHPALLDNATGFLSHHENLEGWLPFCYERVVIHRRLPGHVFSRAVHLEDERPGTKRYEVVLHDADGATLLQASGFTMRKVEDDSSTYRQYQAPAANLPPENFRVEIDSPGHLQSLRFKAVSRPAPGVGEVEIEVMAAGLNFIEVLYALGMLPKPPGLDFRFGLECSGRVARVGPGVESFREGDEVFAMASTALSRYAVTEARNVAAKPAGMSWAAAAGLSAAYVTAWYSLVTKAGLRRGERVLIHSAAGGVGLAAVNIARYLGADVLATSGSDQKRDYLRELGIQHVSDSRSLGFAEDVMAQTGGEGVDVVLNSLGGEFIDRGLSVLRRYGRFIEMGKRDIFQGTPVNLRHFERQLSFIAVDVGRNLPDFESVWSDLVERIRDGSLPELPQHAFRVTELAEAMEYMAQAKHIGKVVLEVAGCVVIPTTRPAGPATFSLDDIIGPTTSSTQAVAPQKATFEQGTSPSPSSQTPSHQRPELETPYLAPSDETESALAEIWQQLLGIDRVGANDNFFELHGDSLLAAQLVSRIQQIFQVALPISIVFDAATVAGQAQRISQIQQGGAPPRALALATGEHEEGEI